MNRQLIHPNLSAIVAVSENMIIGVDGDLPWHLPADLKRFKQLTMGHTIVMGRKTYESIGRPLPGRTMVVLTRNPDVQLPHAVVVSHRDELQDALREDPEPFLVGGSEIYRQFLADCRRIFLTRVHTEISGDSILDLDWTNWQQRSNERYEPDDRNPFAYSFQLFESNKSL